MRTYQEETIAKYLAHYGVKGMRWGVRSAKRSTLRKNFKEKYNAEGTASSTGAALSKAKRSERKAIKGEKRASRNVRLQKASVDEWNMLANEYKTEAVKLAKKGKTAKAAKAMAEYKKHIKTYASDAAKVLGSDIRKQKTAAYIAKQSTASRKKAETASKKAQIALEQAYKKPSYNMMVEIGKLRINL